MSSSTAPSSTGPRYAPDDPTLPKPWRGLVDGNTGYLYYWNPDTNVTQYERPASTPLPPPPPLPLPPPKSASVPISSSVQIQDQSGSSVHGHHRHNSKDDDNRHPTSGKNGPRLAPVSAIKHHQGSRGSSSHSLNTSNGTANAGHAMPDMHNHASGSRSSNRTHGSFDAEVCASVESYRRQHEITVSGVDVPEPFMTFDTTGFPSDILREVHNAGFSAPTPIQAQSWPIALQSRDIVAIAKTGSGKTLGYLLPAFIHIKRCHNNPQKGPAVLVLSPTRELATQIQDEAVKFGRSSRIMCTCLYGGAPKGPQLRDLNKGVDIVVATPGRLNDILEMKKVSLRQVSYLVLDEADRMLDMGFEPQIRKIVKEIPSRRQTLMYTATWPKEVRRIAADLLVDPIQVNIGNIDELVANKSITQHVELLTPMEKQRRLEQILRSQEPGSKVIIFCTTKKTCDQLARSITRQFGAAAIHGDKSQGERDYVLNQFRTGRSPILVATDVAARGLDIKDIRVVINYDFPTGIEDYVHRIGRTGRAGATGVSYTFFCDQDAKHAKDLVKILEGAGQRVPSDIRNMATRGRGMGKSRRRYGSGSRDGNHSHVGLNDLSRGGRVARGLPSSGRVEGTRGGRGVDNREPRDRHDRRHFEGHDADVHGKYERGHHAEVIDRRDRARGRSPSRSPSHNRGRDRTVRSRSRSRSRGRNHGHVRSRSRSRSRDRHGRGYERHHRLSPAPKRPGSPLSHRPANSIRAPLSNDQERWASPPRCHNEDVNELIDRSSSQSPMQERSKSPYADLDRRLRSQSPYNQSEERGSPPDGGRGVGGDLQSSQGLPVYRGEEEEEGMILPDDTGLPME